MTIDYDGLELVYQAGKRVDSGVGSGTLDMDIWWNECETKGCLIGWFKHFNPNDRFEFAEDHNGVMTLDYFTQNKLNIGFRFGLSKRAVEELFIYPCNGAEALNMLRRFIDSHRSSEVNNGST